MGEGNKFDEIARLIVDAFDMDIQLFQGRVLRGFANTPKGSQFANWDRSNPQMFDMMLRLVSAGVQKLHQDKNIATSLLADQMKIFPVELRRAILDDFLYHNVHTCAPGGHSTTAHHDPEFNAKYEEAIKDLSEMLI